MRRVLSARYITYLVEKEGQFYRFKQMEAIELSTVEFLKFLPLVNSLAWTRVAFNIIDIWQILSMSIIRVHVSQPRCFHLSFDVRCSSSINSNHYFILKANMDTSWSTLMHVLVPCMSHENLHIANSLLVDNLVRLFYLLPKYFF